MVIFRHLEAFLKAHMDIAVVFIMIATGLLVVYEMMLAATGKENFREALAEVFAKD